MTPRIVFRPEAEAELLDARGWYEAERPGLGSVFGAAIETSIAAISQSPGAYSRVSGDIRRAVVRRFPYAVYFRTTSEEIVILAVVHGHRNPRVWRSRR